MINSKRALYLSCVLVLSAIPHAAAQSVEVFGGFTAARMKPGKDYSSTTSKGWNTSVTAYPASRFGITADFAGYTDTVRPQAIGGDVDVRQYSFLAGPQFRLFRRERFETSFRAMVGAARAYVPTASLPAGYASLDQTGAAALFGSNFDINLSRHVALRFSPGIYLTHFAGETQKNMRFSVGPVFRFGHAE
jgi:hypothetical protein